MAVREIGQLDLPDFPAGLLVDGDAGSLAATVSPRAKNTTVQLAPIVPVPIAATRLILSPAMSVSSRPPALAEPKASMSDRDDRASPCSPRGEVRPLSARGECCAGW